MKFSSYDILILTKQRALKITWGLCTKAMGSNGAPALPPPYAPPASIFPNYSSRVKTIIITLLIKWINLIFVPYQNMRYEF